MPAPGQPLLGFIHSSNELLRTFHGIARLPALPPPPYFPKDASPAVIENWNTLHPDLRGALWQPTNTSDPFLTLLKFWHDHLRIAFTSADAPTQISLASLATLLGPPQFLCTPYGIDHLFALIRDPLGIFLHKFAHKLLDLERDLARLAVARRPDDPAAWHDLGLYPDPISVAIAMKSQNQFLSIRKIAKAVGVAHTTLVRNPTWKAAANRLKQVGRGPILDGFRTPSGHIEAVAPD